MKIILLYLYILILFSIFSCSKKDKKNKVHSLEKNIEITINQPISSPYPNQVYKFSKMETLKYKLTSFQLFTSKFNQFLTTFSFVINFKKEDDKYKVYFTDFKLKNITYYGYADFKEIKRRYELTINSLYFYVKINKTGKKEFFTDRQISSNPNLMETAYFIYGIIEKLFPEFPVKGEIKYYKYIKDYDGNYQKTLKEKLTVKKIYYPKYLLLKGKNKKLTLRLLFNTQKGITETLNYLIISKDNIKFNMKDYPYSLKNYFFIKKIPK